MKLVHLNIITLLQNLITTVGPSVNYPLLLRFAVLVSNILMQFLCNKIKASCNEVICNRYSLEGEQICVFNKPTSMGCPKPQECMPVCTSDASKHAAAPVVSSVLGHVRGVRFANRNFRLLAPRSFWTASRPHQQQDKGRSHLNLRLPSVCNAGSHYTPCFLSLTLSV